MRLEGKRALVTGAQQGIGRAAVLALAHEGADVVINWFEGQPAANQLSEEVHELKRRSLCVQGDVSKSVDVTQFVDEAYRGLGGLDILINNAGVFPRSPFLQLDRGRMGSCARRQSQGQLPRSSSGGSQDGRGWHEGRNCQHIVVIGARARAGRPLLGQQERHHRYHALDGVGACATWHPRQCGRAWHHKYGAAPLSVFGSRDGRAVPPRAAR